ncbi:MAG: cupin domain-containing protein [Chloroflexota bacterium]
MKSKKLEGKATPLLELIDYQADSIVSRTIIDKEAGTVTAFAFDKDQGLSEHTAPYDAIVQILEGEVRVTVSGRPIIVKQNEITIMPANQPHTLFAVTQFKMLLTMIKA